MSTHHVAMCVEPDGDGVQQAGGAEVEMHDFRSRLGRTKETAAELVATMKSMQALMRNARLYTCITNACNRQFSTIR